MEVTKNEDGSYTVNGTNYTTEWVQSELNTLNANLASYQDQISTLTAVSDAIAAYETNS